MLQLQINIHYDHLRGNTPQVGDVAYMPTLRKSEGTA